MPTRKATASWSGGLKNGTGDFAGESGVIAGKFDFGTRFGDAKGTNPEELLAAAQAACFSMALSGALEGAGHPPTRVETEADCTVEKVGDGFRITKMKIIVRANVPGIDAAEFQRLAQEASTGCPVSRVFTGNLEKTLEATLV